MKPFIIATTTASARSTLLGALAAVALAGCPAPVVDDADCGPDTQLVDGACVSTLTPTVCGEGAVLDEASGECVPTTTCAPGTTLDPATQTCVGDASCAAGTTLDPTTGECIGDVACGEGTVYDPSTRLCIAAAVCAAGSELDVATQRCVPVNRCGDGTIRDSLTNLCVPEVVCGRGLVAIDGVCVSADDELLAQADVVEPGNDDNDPGLGGTPEQLALEGAGEAVVFAGTIGRAVDIDGDGNDDQDRDFWRFTATGSTALRLRVLSLGLPSPAFRITGPEGYVRDSRRGDLEPLRELVLPRSGDYVVEVTTVAAFDDADDAPLVGSPAHRYIGVIEEMPFPASRDLTLAPLPTLTQVTGSVLGLADNAVHLRGPAASGAQWTANVDEGGTQPVILVFDGARRFLQEVEFTRTSQVLNPLHRPAWLQNADDVIVLVDWRTSAGADSAFSVTAASLPTTNLGEVAVDALLEAPRVVIPGQFAHTFTFTAHGQQILRSSFAGAGTVNALLVGPDGIVDTATTLANGGHAALLPRDGDYVWVVMNATTSDVNVSPGLQSLTPVDAGVLTIGGAARTFSGDDLRPRRRFGDRFFVVASVAEAAIVQGTASFSFGMGDLEMLTVDASGALRNRAFRSEDSVVAIARDITVATRVVLALDQGTSDPPNPAVRDWTLTLRAVPPPTTFEAEPNDDSPTATLLPAPSVVGAAAAVIVRGSIVDNELDRFRLELEEALPAGTVLDVQLQNLTQTNATFLRVFDDAGTKISEANETVVTGTFILPIDGAGPFFIELEGTGTTVYDYALVVERRAVLTEVEPNDSTATATTIDVSSLPTRVFGRSRSNEIDHFTFTLPAPLPAGTGLLLRARNEVESDDVDLTLRAANGTTTIATTRHEDGVLLHATGSETTFFVQVNGRASTRPEFYALTVDTIGPVELEPNNTLGTATPLPLDVDGAARVYGQGVRDAIDVYRVELGAPLAAGEALSVRWDNLLERGDIEVRVFDSNEALLLLNEDYSNEIVVGASGDAGPFYVEVRPVASSSNVRPEPYLLEVERIAATAEREPNNDVATAQPIASGAAIRGQSRSTSTASANNGDPDVFALVVGDSGEIDVVVSAVHRLDDVIVGIVDADGETLAAGTDIDVVLSATAAPGSTVTIQVQSTQPDTEEFRVYTLVATSD